MTKQSATKGGLSVVLALAAVVQGPPARGQSPGRLLRQQGSDMLSDGPSGSSEGTRTPRGNRALAPQEVLAGNLREASGVAVSPDGRIYVTDMKAGAVFEISTDGAKPRLVVGGLRRPRGLSWEGPDSLLLVAERGDSRRGGAILRYERSARRLTIVAEGLRGPRGLARAHDGTVFVSAEGIRAVRTSTKEDAKNWAEEEEEEEGDGEGEEEHDRRLTFSGSIISWSTTTGLQVVAQGFNRPDGILVRADSTLLVAAGGYRARGQRLEGSVFSVNSAGEVAVYAPDLVDRPRGLALDATEALFLTGRRPLPRSGDPPGLILKIAPGRAPIEFAVSSGTPASLALSARGDLLATDAEAVLRFRSPNQPSLQAGGTNVSNQDPFHLRGSAEPGSLVLVVGGREPISAPVATGTFDVPVSLRLNQANALRAFAIGAAGDGLASAPAESTIVHDNVPPTITTSIDPPANAAGWHRTAARVEFTCADASSGIATCQPPIEVALEGAAQAIHGAATDLAGNTATATVSLNVDTTAPSAIPSRAPAPNAAGWNNSDVTVTFACADALSGVAICPGANVVATEGALQRIAATATDVAGNSSAAADIVSLDKSAPVVQLTSPADGAVLTTSPIVVEGTVTDALSGIVSIRCNGDPAAMSGSSFTCTVPLGQGPNLIVADADDLAGNSASSRATVTLGPKPPSDGLPPDPATVAPPVDPTVATQLLRATEFLYTGSNPIQTGVAPGTIELRRAAVLRGKVITADGAPLSGVRITIHDHPEFGATSSRADGMFDMAVNGGGPLTIRYAKQGFLPAQRQAQARWQDYADAADVALVPLDAEVTAVDLSPGPAKVARGSVVTDADGTRQATLIFPEGGTMANMELPDGSVLPALARLHVRATEYTVGPNGPRAMPGELPPTSGYTYAVELSADEAIAAGATRVSFGRPVIFHVENFLNFPVGTIAPVGFYDPDRATWVPADNGRVIRIVGVTGGLADVDTVGGGALPPVVLDDAERQRLASLYAVGQTLWRVPIAHFSPWDINWGIAPPDDAVAPAEDPEPPEPLGCHVGALPQNEEPGSIIGCQNQTLGEAVRVAGTPFALHYASDRTPGNKAAYSLDIPLSGGQVPASLRRIELVTQVAGQVRTRSFPPTPNQRTTFVWDGKDTYGRTLQGVQRIVVRIGYIYGAVYAKTSRFGYNGGGGITASRARLEVTLWRTWQGLIGAWDAPAAGLGGWTLTPHHTYDPAGQVLYRGDGRRETLGTAGGPIITTFAGGVAGGLAGCDAFGNGVPATQAEVCPRGLATAPDGSLYIADLTNRIRRVAPSGIITTVAGTGSPGFSGDGGPATQARLNAAYSVAVGLDGSLYIGEINNARVRRVGRDGIIRTVAGTGVGCPAPNHPCGDGGPATLATVIPQSLAVGPDGSLYIGDGNTRRVRRVTADGIIATVAGTGGLCGSATAPCGDGGPATQAPLTPTSIAVDRDGRVYIADSSVNRVRRVTPDGIIRTIAGTGALGFSGDGGPAGQATFNGVEAIALGGDGSLYMLDSGNRRIRWLRPTGTIHTLAGNGEQTFSGDGGPAALAGLEATQATDSPLAVGPDGSVYAGLPGFFGPWRVRQISSRIPGLGFDGGGLAAAPDASEVYVLAPGGRHLRTVDALTGALREEFAYDAAGRLARVTDGDGNVTTIERDAAGSPTAIVGPFGQRTSLTVNADGYLSRITNPAAEAVELAYTADGLLTGFTNPRGNGSSYAYDAAGRLASATDATGATKTLARTGNNRDYTVTLTSAAGRVTTYRVERLATGSLQSTTTDPAGAETRVVLGPGGTQTATYPDGTRVTLVLGPDPRWGMQAPVAASQVMTTPGGLVRTATVLRRVTLGAANDPLSLRTQTDTLSINGRASITTFDAPSRTLTTTSAAGRRSTLVLDDRARPARRQFGDLEATALTYDDRGRLATVAQGGRITSFTYGGDGFLARLTDAIGRTIAFTNDAGGRVTEERLPGDRVVRFTYDPNGNLTALTPPGRPDHTFSYTPRDDVATYVPPAVGAEIDQEQYSYNTDGQPRRGDRADGQAVQFQYDTAGRLSLLGLVSGDRSYSYDAAGRLASLTAPLLSMTYTYDGALSTGSVWSGAIPGSVTRTFDNDLRVISHRVDGADPVATQYDADSLRTQVGALSLTRSMQTGFITATALGAASDSRRFDTFGDLIQYSASHGGSVAYALDLTRDALGRITSKTERLGGATHVFSYTYDVAGRLAEVRQDGLLTEAYTYDANDNRLTGPQPVVTYAYDEQDRLTQRSGLAGQNYSYTPNGERQSKSLAGQTTTYRYDSLGQVSGVSLPGGAQIDYVLDGIGRRVGKRVNGALVQGFLYQDALRPIAELDGAGNVVSRFVYAGLANVPEYLMKGGATYRIIADQLGSPRLLIDTATGSVAQQLDYDTFGNVLLDTNPGFQPFGFAGGLYDPDTKLTRYGLRDYDAETGGWTTRDPRGFSGGPNLYSYAYSDPANFIDPLGNAPKKLASTGYVQSGNAGGVVRLPGSHWTQSSQPFSGMGVQKDILRSSGLEPPSLRTPPGPGGGTSLLPRPPSALGRICRATPYVVAAAIEVGYWAYLAHKQEWGQLTQSVVRNTPVGDTGWGAVDVIDRAGTGDLQGAGWTYVKNLVPIIGFGERLFSDDSTPFWKAEWWPD
jgi:RHS repeat-associated protein